MPDPVCHVDVRCLEHQRTGIGVFTAEVVAHWPGAPALRGHDSRDHRAPWHLRVARVVRRSGAPYLSTDSLIVPTLLGRRATIVVHDLAPVLHPGTMHLRAKLAYRLLLGVALRRVGAVVVPSRSTHDDLVRLHPHVATKVHVVPEAPRVLPPPAPLPPAVTQPFVLHTGTHEPRKNLLALVEGFLSQVPAPFTLVLAGKRGWLSADQAAALDALVADGGGRVLALGFVPDEVLSGLYRAAHVVVYPSEYEGFGLPLLEAMAAGAAVVTTDAAALAELAGDAAVVVALGPGLPDRLGRALFDLLVDEPRRAELVRRGRARAALYSWRRTAQGVHAAVLTTGEG